MTTQLNTGERLQLLQPNDDNDGAKLERNEWHRAKPKRAGLQLVGGASPEFGLRIVREAARWLVWALVRLLAKLFKPTNTIRRVDCGQHERTRSTFGTTTGDCAPVRLDSAKQTQRSSPELDARSQSGSGRQPTRLEQTPSVQMSREIVAGFEEQQVAHELSAQVVEEALQAIIGRLTMGSPEPTAEADRPNDANKDGARAETEDDSRSGGPEVEASLDGSLAASSSGLDEDTDEHCGRQASQINLRQLRLSALEDMLVCDQRRHNTKAARHLFNRLANQTAAGPDERAKLAYCGTGRRHAAANQMGSSMSSRSGDNNSDDDNNSADSNRLDIDSLDELLGGCQADEANDCGTIKLERRCCSSSSSSSVNFGRTLVCSVSPTGQFNLNATNTNNNNHHKALNIHELGNGQANQERNDDDLNYYPINGDEIRQCRAAFRENRRLIEQAQSEAVGRHLAAGASLSRSASQATMRPDRVGQDRSRWAASLGRRSRLPDCSRCQQKLYPVDKMDLDFTRATLNIHRNCFKCQVCATLLRLETYASIDTKLYCPAHVKCVAPSR